MKRGRSSGVEHNLAKVRVVSSNLIARSIRFKISSLTAAFFMDFFKWLKLYQLR